MKADAGVAPRTRPLGACPVCGGQGAAPFFEAPDRMHGVPGTFSYRRCRGCRTVFQDPRVPDEELPLLYPGSYYTHASRSSGAPATVTGESERGVRGLIRGAVQRAQAPRGRNPLRPSWGGLLAASRWVRERAFYDLVHDEMLPWRTPPGRALDVGCGSGELMLRLAALGWQVAGVEPDASAAEVARARTGAQVQVAGVAALHPEEIGRFDLVTVSHVLEHLGAPGEALRTLARLTCAGGRLVVIYPNPDSFGARAFGGHWFAWDPPRHLVVPARGAWSVLLDGSGLEIRRMRTLSRLAADHAMQSSAYRKGRGYLNDVPGFWHRGFGGLERALVAVGLPVGEEILLHLEPRT